MKSNWLLTCTALAIPALPAAGSDVRDSTFGYTVSPPAFSAPAQGTAMVRLVVNGPSDAGFAPNMNVMVQETRITRDQYMALSQKQFAAAGMSIRASEKRDVSGRPGVLFEYEGQMQGRSMRFLSLAVLLPERVLLVTYTAPAAGFGGLEAEFRRSLESFKLGSK